MNSTEKDNPEVGSPGLPRFSRDGVDLTLIRWMLDKTPGERLAALQQQVPAIQRLRHAKRIS